jgi:hypothetical protein
MFGIASIFWTITERMRHGIYQYSLPDDKNKNPGSRFEPPGFNVGKNSAPSIPEAACRADLSWRSFANMDLSRQNLDEGRNGLVSKPRTDLFTHFSNYTTPAAFGHPLPSHGRGTG